MAEVQEHKLASTRADRSSDLKPMARRRLEDYPTVDAYQTCCIMSTEEEVVLSNENVVTGVAPRARLSSDYSSDMEIVPGLLHGTLGDFPSTFDSTNKCAPEKTRQINAKAEHFDCTPKFVFV